jgi:hypothetical protein
MYKTFYGRIPAAILFSCLFLLAVNGFLLFYSSAVLSEPLFILIQSALMFFFCKYFVSEQEDLPIKKQILRFFVIAVLVLCLTLTRTVGYAAIGVIAIYFLMFGQWKKALLSVVSNAAVFWGFGLLKKLLWPSSGSAYSLRAFFTKDMYNPDRGMEDAGGIVVRLFENINNYLSMHTYRFLGLDTELKKPSVIITVIIVVLFVWGGYAAYRKNRFLFLAALYTLGFCLANFIILHATWLQERFIIVYYPLILFILLTGIYYLLQSRRNTQFLFIGAVAVLFFGSFSQTLGKVKDNSASLKMSLNGNTLYGLTPDWQNYIKISQWAAKNVPDSLNIAARKPSTSVIYGNRNFHGIYGVPSVPKDTLNTWKPGAGKIAFIVDLSSKTFPQIAQYLTFAASGKAELRDSKREQVTKTAIAGIYEIPAADSLQAAASLYDAGVGYTLDYETYRASFLKNPDNLLYSPEEMLNSLKNANVKYMILASLRINPTMNTGSVINTLHRYLSIMELKYPGLAIKKFTVGGDVEPATLIELNY